MRFVTTFLAGLLLIGTLALAPDSSFARGGGGGGHFGGFHGAFGSRGYPGYYGYYGPFDYGVDDYADPYYDDNDSSDVQPAPSDVAPDESMSLTVSVQKELAQLGYYHGPIDGIAGSETERAYRYLRIRS